MEKAARRFASWVLGMHFLVLALLVVIVILATAQVYSSARRQALDQLRVRQELLAAQSARGIGNFYRFILGDLELQRRAESGDLGEGAKRAAGAKVARGVIPPLIWQQL